MPKSSFAVKLEFGYPNLDVGFLFGASQRVHLGVGYRGLYSLNHTPYAELKWSVNARHRDKLGLALVARTGYSLPGTLDGSSKYLGNELSGEYGGFGELWLMGTARRGRHGLLLGVGGFIGQTIPDRADVYYYDETEDPGPVMGKLSLEIGYELRINAIACFFLALGVDMFMNSPFLPAMVRFRLGVLLGT